MRIDLVAPAPLAWHSGGSAYDERLAASLASAGADVRIHVAAGAWPEGSADDRAALGALLTGISDDGGTHIIVDGLVGLGCPGEIAAAGRAGLAVWVLVHMPVADMPSAMPAHLAALEAEALAVATGAITPSRFTAADLARRYCVDAAVAIPGVDRAPLARGSQPPRIVCVAALLPGKRQLLLLDTLERLVDLPWTAELIGSDRADPEYAHAVRKAADSAALRGRVRVTGELLGNDLEAGWAAADLSVLPSEKETFGLVVAESLARGVPAIVQADTGAEEALALSVREGFSVTARADGTWTGALAADTPTAGAWAAGTAVHFETDDAVDALRSWLTDPVLRTQWAGAARAARSGLPGWDSTARAALEALGLRRAPSASATPLAWPAPRWPTAPLAPAASPPTSPASPPASPTFRARRRDSPLVLSNTPIVAAKNWTTRG